MYQSLSSILDFEGNDEEFENTFELNFQIGLSDNFGNVVNFNLKENGDKISVNVKNRQVKYLNTEFWSKSYWN